MATPASPRDKDGYHHGDLRAAVLAAAAEQIAASGVAGVSLRDLARQIGVSHAAPAHHFGDRRGLLTALATEGFELLAGELAGAEDLRDAGVAYVRFALAHPGHFAVMFRRDLLHMRDPALRGARERAWAMLRAGVAALPGDRAEDDERLGQLAAWSLVHGFAALWLDGELAEAEPGTAADAETLAGRLADLLLAGLRTA